MNRRRFLIGVGSLTAGGSVVVGSGAFSAAEMNRDANINVVNDSNGLIALTPGPNVESDVVREENGELTIDFTADGSAGGVNINSRYQVGTFETGHNTTDAEPIEEDSDIGNNYAFSIKNLDTTEHTMWVHYEADNIDEYEGCTLYLQFVPIGDVPYKFRDIDESHGNGRDGFSTDVSSDEGYEVSILVDTRDATEGVEPEDIDLSGELQISAN